MLNIGDFSKIAKVSVRMLRHYDQIGLLKPAAINSTSGYRYYDIGQLHRLNRIVFLKDMGFSLNEVSALIDDQVSMEAMKAMLAKRQLELENQIQMAQQHLRQVTSRLAAIESENELPKYDVTIKPSEGYCYVSLRENVASVKEMGACCYNLYMRLYEALSNCGVQAVGPEIMCYHNEEYSETDLDVEVGTVIKPEDAQKCMHERTPLSVRVVAAEDTVASVIYSGPFDQMEGAIIELLVWIGSNNWEIAGALREIHRSGPAHEEGNIVDRAIVELQLPVKKLS